MLQVFIVMAALILDQATKYLVTQSGGDIPIISGVFHLHYARNYGAAFGILTDMQVIIIIITAIVCALIIALMIRERKAGPLLRTALSLMLGGALGNLVDRLVLGYVVDFFDVRIIRFAIFNVADCCVVVGTILFCVYIIFVSGRDKNPVSLRRRRTEDA